MDVDRPEVVAEVADVFAGYEAALVAGDVQAIIGYFWDSPATIRFGIADHQVGIEEQRRWRMDQPPLPPGRRLYDTVISTFGADTAVVNTLFDYPGGGTAGRQTQIWVRLPVGWRIVAAHVSQPAGVPSRR